MLLTYTLCTVFFTAVLAATTPNGLPNYNNPNGKVVCYYDHKSFARESQGKMMPSDVEPALHFCTHLIYGYAGIQPDTYKMVPLNQNLDVDPVYNNYRLITSFKSKFPGLKVLLSVGGDADSEEATKYNYLLENPQARTAFINSGIVLAEQYGFDGIDLAWQFPKTKPKRIRSAFGSFWHGLKKTFGTTPIDEKESEHREGFTALVREFKQAISHKPMILTMSVLPNVNSTIYHDVPATINNLEFVNLLAFDYYTPERNPKEADYSAPTNTPLDRNPHANIDALVNYWLQHGAPGTKIILGIATFGRTWKLTADSSISGVPPLYAEGPGEAGPYTKIEGLLSYPEVCGKLINPNNQKGLSPHLRKVTDPSRRFGTYAFRVPDDSGEGGLWVSYEDPETAVQKTEYAKNKRLGGIGLVDLSLDDFRGLCTGDKYPLLRAAHYKL